MAGDLTSARAIEVVMGDVRDAESFRSAMSGTDVVFHLAALISISYSYDAYLSYVQSNVDGTLNVLQEALKASAKCIVHTSTSQVYGTARYVPIDEEHVLRGQSPYSASKIAADMMAEAFHLSYGLPMVTLRPFNRMGPASPPGPSFQIVHRDPPVMGSIWSNWL